MSVDLDKSIEKLFRWENVFSKTKNMESVVEVFELLFPTQRPIMERMFAMMLEDLPVDKQLLFEQTVLARVGVKHSSLEEKEFLDIRKQLELEKGTFIDQYIFATSTIVDKNELRIKWLTRSAMSGYHNAQFMLGCWNHRAKYGLPRNNVAAIYWYKKAAAQNNSMAKFSLGQCCMMGDGCTKDEKAAIRWYTEAAVCGNIEAQYELGNCFENGLPGAGIKRDDSQAFAWYLQAADNSICDDCNDKALTQIQTLAKNKLANCYYYGKGVEADKQRAVNYYMELPEDHKFAEAHFNLARCYDGGSGGLVVNQHKAVQHFVLASNQGYAQLKQVLDIVMKKVSEVLMLT